jgi:hypothetical protein
MPIGPIRYIIVILNAHYARKHMKEFKLSYMFRRYPAKRYVIKIHSCTGTLQHTVMCTAIYLASKIKSEA